MGESVVKKMKLNSEDVTVLSLGDYVFLGMSGEPKLWRISKENGANLCVCHAVCVMLVFSHVGTHVNVVLLRVHCVLLRFICP